MRCVCGVCAVCVCGALCVRCVCGVCAVCVRCVCGVCAVCVRCVVCKLMPLLGMGAVYIS